jgi:hypothetical protein
MHIAEVLVEARVPSIASILAGTPVAFMPSKVLPPEIIDALFPTDASIRLCLTKEWMLEGEVPR